MNVYRTALSRFRRHRRELSAVIPAFLGILALWGSISPEKVRSQALQLPSFQHFDASTTVQVPDGGSAYTAGITRSSSGERISGTPLLPFQNRSFGSDSSVSSMHTSVQIIDLQEMDEQILNSPSPVRVRRPNERLSPADRWTARQETAGPGTISGSADLRRSFQANARDLQEPGLRGRSGSQVKSGKAERTNALAERTNELRQPLHLEPALRAPSQLTVSETKPSKDIHADLDLFSETEIRAVHGVSVSGSASPLVSRSPKKAVPSRSGEKSRQEAALKLAQKGFSAEKAGKTALALSYYEQAEELAAGKLLSRIQKRRLALLEK